MWDLWGIEMGAPFGKEDFLVELLLGWWVGLVWRLKSLLLYNLGGSRMGAPSRKDCLVALL